MSDDRKQVTCGDEQQDIPDTAERFDGIPCVLGRQGFSSGRFYSEVQVKDKIEWTLGVAKESCKREVYMALGSIFGYWTIRLREGKYEALTDHQVPLHLSQKPQKVGVFVDYEVGKVSFYNVEARCHIYSFTDCSFTERLHPFFSPGSPVDFHVNIAPLVICPVEGVVPESPSLVSQSRPEPSQGVQAGSSTTLQLTSLNLKHMNLIQLTSLNLKHMNLIQLTSLNLKHMNLIQLTSLNLKQLKQIQVTGHYWIKVTSLNLKHMNLIQVTSHYWIKVTSLNQVRRQSSQCLYWGSQLLIKCDVC
ncbi:E3 ubiquitin-protein ligase TRIM21-like isoform X2 [Osmerus eperlanus]|uniref:E3 ubiquitin-protein ligase TRIM21-like isoform X2 n=1 Tax=Osmerus eperlanus TaxID=29151 RepID=UPI002E0EB4B8